MAINNLNDLQALQADLSTKATEQKDKIEILIGMGTCGLAAGAGDTYNRISELLISKKMKNVTVVPVGCVGFCHSEPTIQVTIPGEEPTIYGKISAGLAEEFVETVIVNGEILEDYFLTTSFKKAVV